MNNTRTLAIVAVLTAATLVVGLTSSAATAAFAKGDDNGNTITALKCQNKGSASGFDTAVYQECENLICSHPGNDATCTQEGSKALTSGNTSSGGGRDGDSGGGGSSGGGGCLTECK
jgi:uncharacterized membrane protein YgcG